MNGVPLDNAGEGWRLLSATLPRVALSMRSTDTVSAGRDGVNSAPATRAGIVPQFEVIVPEHDWEKLLAIFSKPELIITRADLPGRALFGELKSSSTPKDYPRSRMVSALFYVDVPDGCWRGTEWTSPLISPAPAGATASVFTGMSAPIQDAVVRFKGPIEKPMVTDSSGAFCLVDGALNSDEYLRFDSNSGRAWKTSADSWSGGEEVSGEVDFGGPRGVFEITPHFVDPASRAGSVRLSQTSFVSGAGVQIRGRAAYLA